MTAHDTSRNERSPVSCSTVRLFTVAAATTAAVGLTALPALAHVNVSSPATQGGYGVVTFRVPTESATASTVGLKIQLPTDTPLASVSVKPKTGWTYTVTRAELPTPVRTDDGELTEAPSVVEWKAATPAAGIKPGEFDEFQINAGPMPEKDSVTFKAIQTYSDGKTVDWIEEQPEGSSEEPEYPAPVLKLTTSDSGTDAHGGTTGSDTDSADGDPAQASGSDDGGPGSGAVIGSYVVGGVGLLASLAALGLVLARRRTAA
jgi:periplasmic copper chaperone A